MPWQKHAARCMNAMATALALFACLAPAAARAAPPPDTINYAGTFPTSTPSGLTRATLTLNDQARDVLVYRPANVTAPPLLIFYSGTGATLEYNSADELGRETLRQFADSKGLVLLIPIPLIQTRGDWDNHSAGTPYWETATGEAVDSPPSSNPDTNPDLRFTRAMIKEAIARYGVDANKVFVNGFSNGAFFSYFVAAVLNDRIAAFAETGGGLVRSRTTAGDPTPCRSVPFSGAQDEVRSCSGAGWTSGTCVTPGAPLRPIDPAAVSRVPPGFLEHNDNDDSVAFQHTCNLSEALPASTPKQTRIMHTNNGHGVNGSYLENSWNFMLAAAGGSTANPQTGWWWNPNESGRGYFLEKQGNNLFLSGYLYADSGRATWFVAYGPLSGQRFSAGMQVYRDGQTLTGAYRNPASDNSPGALTLDFSSSTQATLTWPGGTVPLQRFPFGPGNTVAAPQAGSPESGWWWNSSESGRGFSLEIQGNNLFMAGYMYDAAGDPIWYLSVGSMAGTSAYTGSWAQYGNGQTLTGAYRPAQLVNGNVGSVTLDFSGSQAATLTLPDGRRVSLTRFGF